MKRISMSIAAGVAVLAMSTGVAAAATGVTDTDLNVRRGPGTGYGVVTAIPEGAAVHVFGCQGSWCHVAWNGYVGYSSRHYLDIGENAYAEAPPPVAFGPGPYVSTPLFSFGFGEPYGYHHWHHGWHHHWHH